MHTHKFNSKGQVYSHLKQSLTKIMRKKKDDDDSLAKYQRKMDIEEIHEFIPMASLRESVHFSQVSLKL